MNQEKDANQLQHSTTEPEPEPISGHVTPLGTVVGEGVTLLQLNVEGISSSKLSIIEHLATT